MAPTRFRHARLTGVVAQLVLALLPLDLEFTHAVLVPTRYWMLLVSPWVN
jgi:hypothetical protein